MYQFLIWMIVCGLKIGSSAEVFNITLKIPNIGQSLSNQSVFTATKLPIDEELYIVDFHPIYDRQKVRFITTYLCSKAYTTKENIWFGNQPCYNMDLSMIIYEWYYNIPAVQWPKDAGFRVGGDTPYRYVVIHIQYLASAINDTYGQQMILTHTKPKYKIGTYQILTSSLPNEKNRAEFSCLYGSQTIQVFSTHLSTNNEIGRSISLYRIRNNQSQLIIKGNLHWPKTFYQLQNSIDIQNNDYLIGGCVYENRSINQIGNEICQILMMFWMNQNDEMLKETCSKNDFPQIIERFLPNDAYIPPQTLFDINPIYPKLSPNEWSMDTTSNILSLAYTKDYHRLKQILLLFKAHKLLFVIFIWVLTVTIGLLLLIIIILRSSKRKHYSNRSRKIIVGGETSSLSGWLTKRRFQQYDQDDNYYGENQPLNKKNRWASSSEESDLSDNEVFNKTDFRNLQLKN